MRRSGVLLHPTSLPGPHGSGDLGVQAHFFIDWLVSARQQLWQMLPLGPVGAGNSPYMADSAFAGNPLLIDLQELQQQGWLSADDLVTQPDFSSSRVDYPRVKPWRMARLELASQRFFTVLPQRPDLAQEFSRFREQHAAWLADYALFKAIEEQHPKLCWNEWPAALASRDASALAAARRESAARIDHWCFVQWCFERQWQTLRERARGSGITLMGDVPIFVALHSADVWANPHLFQLDASGQPTAVAGVPPDYFSATGQLWGNPLYLWQAHAETGYAWWIARLRRALSQVDELRIDHFRGFAGYWRVPSDALDARSGEWVKGPGLALFQALKGALGNLPLIAEDLGVITPDVIALRDELGLPGMSVLQFAWDGDPMNPHLPHNHRRTSVIYTGTHDNDTTRGWWQDADSSLRQRVCDYFGNDGESGAALIRAALASVAETTLLPMQDVLGLAAGHRMNTPGREQGCWEWRFDWSTVGPEPAQRLAESCERYGRLPISNGGESYGSEA